MPAIHRWRVLALITIFAVISLYYLNQERNVLSFDNTLNVPLSPKVDRYGKTHFFKHPDAYPVTSYIPLPTGQPKKIPQVQALTPVETIAQKKERLRRRDAVKESFQHSWKGYKENAWLKDEVTPLTGTYRDTFGGWAATLVDSLDALWIMGMEKDFEAAVLAVRDIDFSTTDQKIINVFETTIRYLGGLLAAYDISGEKYKILLSKSVEVGELLIASFDTPNRMPVARWDWQEYTSGVAQTASRSLVVSELGSLSLEFTRLSQLTGDPKYYDAVQRISNEFEKSQNNTKLPGMWPVGVDASGPYFDRDNFFTLGGKSDSLYEYLPKQYLLLGGLLAQPKDLYEKFIEVAKEHLFFRIFNDRNAKIMGSGEVRVINSAIQKEPRLEHLNCFTGGMVALAAKIFRRPDDLLVAEELTQACIWAYDVSPNGVSPEIYTVMPCPTKDSCKWDDDLYTAAIFERHPLNGLSVNTDTKAQKQRILDEYRLPKGFLSITDHHYLLRPEAIESVFILYRITGNATYADAAWRMFQAVEKITRTPIAASAIRDVMWTPSSGVTMQQEDSMESFWLAETLKYFYLCFEEWDVVNLDMWVLNTEAHPLKRPDSHRLANNNSSREEAFS
ncbi:hypothetical protein K3495_g6177 [Podosphaera aphanis]|nr:hypothetical protein K3495_g6177 [Podosphaera aphanis]